MPFEDEALEILTGRHVAVLATLVRGGPALACVWYGLDGEDVIVSTPAGRRKANNVRTDPRVALIVDVRDGPHEPGVTAYKGCEVRGQATLEPDPEAILLRKIFTRYLTDAAALAAFEERVTSTMGERDVIRIRPDKVRVWDHARGRR